MGKNIYVDEMYIGFQVQHKDNQQVSLKQWGVDSSLMIFVHMVTLMDYIYKTKPHKKRFWTWACHHCTHDF